jgi:hypothetical protein
VLHKVKAGAAAEPADGRYEDLIDPPTGQVFASTPVSSKADVDLAIAGRRGRLRDPARHHRASGSAPC